MQQSVNPYSMTLEQAHAILDGVRSGVSYPLYYITLALQKTGDL